MAEEQDIFDGLSPGYEGVGEFYDLFADNSDLPFYLHYAKTQGSPILDLAAGAGRVSIALAKAGFEVVALEESESMINQARKRIASLPSDIASRITLVQGDMAEFSLGTKFSLVIIPYSFGHLLTTESQLASLSCIREHLKPDGIFILDLFPGAIQHRHARFRDEPVALADGRSVSRSGVMHLDPIRQILRVDLEYTILNGDGSVVKKVNVTSGAAIIYNREADLLVRHAGLSIIKEYGEFDMRPYDHTSGRRILVIQKSREE